MRTSDFLTQQAKALLENKQQAILYAAVLSVLPFASWLSVAIVALVTLRKGARSGFDVLLPALVIHSVPLMMIIPLSGAFVNTLISYLPCYLAALALRETEQWQNAFGVLALQVFVGSLLIQLLYPDFIMAQFNQLKSVLMQYDGLVESSFDGLGSLDLAQLFFGIQMLNVIVTATVSLLFARSMQARLFLPDGLKNELRTFRSGRLSLLIMIAIAVGCYYEMPLAINMLPLILVYFIASGFGLAYFIFAGKSQVKIFILLFLLVLVNPTFVLLAYIILGSVDSLFNLRTYLPTRVSGSI